MIIPFTTLQILAGGCALIGFFTAFAALATPAWQVVYAREIQQWVQSGLWLNCQTRPSGMYTCTYTFSESDFQFYTSAELINLRTPPFFAWQRHLLAVYLFGQLFLFLALTSLSLSFVASMRRLSAILYLIAISIAAILHIGATLMFAIFSQMVEYRFYHVSVSGIYEKHRGYSFYIEIGATTLIVVSIGFAVGHLIRLTSQMNKNNNKYYYQQQQQHIFEEEPYLAQQQRSLYTSSSNFSGGGASVFGSTNFMPQNIHGMLQPLDHSPYHYSSRSQLDPLEEKNFAMRDLPKLPTYAQNYY